MRLTVLKLVLLMSLATAYGNVNSQMVISSLKLQNAKLSEALEEVEKLSQYDFVFNYNDVKGYEVTVDLEDISLEKCLNEVLCGHPFQYKTEDDLVIVSYKEKAPKPAVQKKKISIKGKVTDEKGVGLPGVSVVVKGTHVGVATNIDGEYNIMVDDRNVTLIFSFVGMETQEHKLKKGNVLDVKLSADQGQLGEVVITGYQNLDGRKKTAAITTVDMKSIETRAESSIDKLLQGQVAGMSIMSTSGAPGSVPQVRIRGTSTISGNVQPLWVVDGVILDDPINVDVSEILTNKNLIASGIGGINVADIQSINVLKDASATALYGTRAANGVIVITSKSGSAGKTRIRYSGNTTLSMRPKLDDAYMMNSKERIDVNREMINKGLFLTNSGRIGEYGNATDFERYFIDVHNRTIGWDEFESKVKELETVNTDWFKHLFRNAIAQNHSLSVSGGNEKTTFYVSSSFRDEQATAKGVGQKTYTGSVKVSTKVRHNIRLDAKLDITSRDNNSFFSADSRENPYEWAIYTTRAQKAFDENGDYNYMYIDDLKYNYLENRKTSWRKSNSFGIRGQVRTEWELFKNFRWTSLFNFSKQSTTEENVAKENSFFVRSKMENYVKTVGYSTEPLWLDGGLYMGRNTQNNSQTIRNQIAYNPTIRNDHELNVMLGSEIRTSEYRGHNDNIYGYVHDRGQQLNPQWKLIEHIGRPYWIKNLNRSANVSYYGVLGYTYKKKYTLNFNARTDGSNRFGIKTNDLFQPLWSAGFNYQMKEEGFMRNIKWISYLTFRGSYGVQGNVAAQAYSDLITRLGTYNTIKNQSPLIISDPKNPHLKWEKNTNSNLALEFGLFDRRVRGTLEYYYKKGEDLLGRKQVSDVTGFRSIQVNWASMENKGLEASLYVKPIQTNNVEWSFSANVGWNKNKVLDVYSKSGYKDLTNAFKTSYESSAVIGKPLSGLYSFRYAGLNENGDATFYSGQFEEDENGNKVEKKVLTGVKDMEALKYEGPTTPPIQAGLTNTISYKNITLSCMLVGSFGNVIRLRQLSQPSSFGFFYPQPDANMPKEWVYRWRKPGDELTTDIPRLGDERYNYDLNGYPDNVYMYNNSDLRTVKGDFVRLQNVSLSYNLYSEKLREKGIQNIQFTLQGSNLHVWKNSKLKGQDPEATGSARSYAASNEANVSFGNTYLPIPRSYSFSINVSF